MSTTALTRILHAALDTSPSARHRAGIWPLPRLDGVAPCILLATGLEAHEGVAIGYPDRASSPQLVPVFAAQDGVVAYARNSVAGATLGIDHADGWSSYYGELEHLLTRPTDRFRCRRKERVRAGDVVGHARRATLRIRFGLSRLTDDGYVEQDPASTMAEWSLLPWFTESGSTVATPAVG